MMQHLHMKQPKSKPDPPSPQVSGLTLSQFDLLIKFEFIYHYFRLKGSVTLHFCFFFQKAFHPKVSTPVPISMATVTSPVVAAPSPPKPVAALSSPLKQAPVSSVSAPPTPVPMVTHPMSLSLGIPPSMVTSLSKPPTPQSHSQPSTPTGGGPMRRRVSDKCNLPISAGTSEGTT